MGTNAGQGAKCHMPPPDYYNIGKIFDIKTGHIVSLTGHHIFLTGKMVSLHCDNTLSLGDAGHLISLTDSHSLRYYEIIVSAPGSGLPEFSVVGYLDDREISYYNSDTQQTLPRAEWMKKLELEYFETQTRINEDRRHISRNDFNHLTPEAFFLLWTRAIFTWIHIGQGIYGCELRDDGSTAVYQQFGYDGRDFMYLDTHSWLYIPVMHGAQLTTQRLNRPDIRAGEIDKNYLENTCFEWLKKNINNGREDLERRVRPEVKVWGRQQPDGVTRLQCLAYGFHPRAVDVKWVRNGEDHIPSDEASPILPHPDGTYQTRVSVKVPTREGDTYSCHVEYSSLEEPLTVPWEPDDGPSVAVIATAVGISCLIAVAAVFGGVCQYKNKCYSRRILQLPKYSFTASPQQCEVQSDPEVRQLTSG
ncbi:major histocompatibility complex class I-related gene protein-like [Hyperolius riggenbachi]|uniref:major histocompatibility complex class I-related gene protein-like n=1 Tax=Hyperolius riggenbachi TaxID=752182 RepID=UPI0035A36E28